MLNVFLLLGANLGDRLATFQQARKRIENTIGPIRVQSSLWETAAWGLTDQPAFLNQVIEVNTEWEPLELLRRTQAIETELGRVRKEKWGARLIDIDLLYYGTEVVRDPELSIPHPYLAERRFTLVPLAEIAPDFVHPVLQLTQQRLLEICTDNSSVLRVEI
ncbi:2-amino-4-hydroxy-6-hydroxymethyldihydropteridine diphosphokinase [Siphonobacter curvatus]|uniref:2-amino-4-hydroxy-6-hydroxymethyldihydropteridine pyrophosphokinase n=1 Tax=Siphonobacter curvatus TaxID=2094562 RepID=A0A2S7IFM6_9BACT|nr:2-amino-4-hydroxy-6-hydroxymethyldihydropteridine diphosphokinase [Siphonobacter curvatus]PQA53806.1 2-amino-4-hydroxy-6-hydroxymethyldihydropteridine diphosphokinase [Siphonobacter curvatus]